MSTRSADPRPSLAELRAVCQPADLLGRVNAEHWAGRLYMRRVSLRLTQLLLRAVDGEVARWRRTCSPAGIYLDRIGHYTTDAALLAALGVRVDGGLDDVGPWTTLGLVAAVLVLVVKAETDLVHVARALGGRTPLADTGARLRGGALRAARRVVRYLPFNRALLTPELTALAALAAGVDALSGNLRGSAVLLAALTGIAAVVAAGHLLTTLRSDKLR